MSRINALFLWLALWLGLCAVVVPANRDLFVDARQPEGDYAANAFSIQRAKEGRELHGNYSRFHFNHPGPAFFYVYAAGERLFRDTLELVPTAFDAHLLSGLLLQAFFLAAALCLLARNCESPWKAGLLLLATAALHFACVPYAFYDTWPPFALLMPFVCFLTACACVSVGQASALPWCFLAGGFLVHGHVAQPLFVLPLFLAALFLFWRGRAKQPENARASLRTPVLVSAVLLALFLAPLALDLFSAGESNFDRILFHLRHADTGERPGWAQALGFTASYFGYCSDQDDWWMPGAGRPFSEFWSLYWPGFLAWGLVSLAGFAALWKRRNERSTELRLARFLALFCCAALALSAFWAKRQDGGLLYFNSYFVFGLAGALLLAFALALAPWLRRALPFGVAALLAVAVLAVCSVKIAGNPHRWHQDGASIEESLPRLLARDPRPRAPKLLQFRNEVWVEAVTLGAALQRHGIDFRVSPEWGFMFGEERVLRAQTASSTLTDYSVWQIDPLVVRPKSLRLARYAGLSYGSAEVLPSLPCELRFGASGDASRFALFGFSAPEEGFAWTSSPAALLRWSAGPVENDVELRLTAAAYAKPQSVELLLAGESLGRFIAKPEEQTVVIFIPKALWNQAAAAGIMNLQINLPDAISPYQCEKYKDWRQLGLKLRSLAFALVKPSPTQPKL